MLIHQALNKRLTGALLSDEVKSSLTKLRPQIVTDDDELHIACTELESNAEVKDLDDNLFTDYLNVQQAQFWISSTIFVEMVEKLDQI